MSNCLLHIDCFNYINHAIERLFLINIQSLKVCKEIKVINKVKYKRLKQKKKKKNGKRSTKNTAVVKVQQRNFEEFFYLINRDEEILFFHICFARNRILSKYFFRLPSFRLKHMKKEKKSYNYNLIIYYFNCFYNHTRECFFVISSELQKASLKANNLI